MWRRRHRRQRSGHVFIHQQQRRRRACVATLVATLVAVRGAFGAIDIHAVTTSSGVTYAGAAGYRGGVVDACGTCEGDGTACQGCDGLANSGKIFDACGSCESACQSGGSCAFNATCASCDGTALGGAVTDACGACEAPTSATFSRAGVPDFHLGGCVGCDGVPNSGKTLDVCGVCGGTGCDDVDSENWSWCCDCAGTPFGTSVINLCCECVESTLYYGTDVTAKPAEHAEVESLWAQGRAAYATAKSLLETFSLQLAPRPKTSARAHLEEAQTAFTAAWTLVNTLKAAETGDVCYPTLAANPQVVGSRDACGVCGGQVTECLGCASTGAVLPIGPLGGLLLDDCNKCDGDTDADVCGLCNGPDDGLACIGCDGVVASGKTFDACFDSRLTDSRMYTVDGVTGAKSATYALGEVGSGCSDPVAFEAACDAGNGGCCGCDGVPNSGKSLDACGNCLVENGEGWISDENKCDEIYLIKLDTGVIIGPYSRDEIVAGQVVYTDLTTDEQTVYVIEPTTMIANAAVQTVVEVVTYGETAVELENVLQWQSIYVDARDDILSSTAEAKVPNEVTVSGQRVLNTTAYEQLQVKDGFVGVSYPFCTGVSYRGEHRLHGKKTGANYFGIVTSSASMPDNWEDAQGKQDFPWNSHSERIYDYVTDWADQRCTCTADWRFDSEPVVPTCERVWLQPSEKLEQASISRSWAGGSWRVSGGWWTQDYGQKTTTTADIARGPRRIDSTGDFRAVSMTTASQTNDELGSCDYAALRVINAASDSIGAVWYPDAQEVVKAFNISFSFMITQPSVTCDTVSKVTGAFVQTLHSHYYETCTTSGGEGFALVIRDDTADAPTNTNYGDGGSNLGYGGIPNSIAIEFDTVYTADNIEPRESHVAIHSRGKSANTAHGSASLATVPLNGATFNDGKVHQVFIQYFPNITVDEMFIAIESGEITGLSTALSAHTADSIGFIKVYVDDFDAPMMSVPFNMETVLRDSKTNSKAYVGFTAASANSWQAVDIITWNMTSDA